MLSVTKYVKVTGPRMTANATLSWKKQRHMTMRNSGARPKELNWWRLTTRRKTISSASTAGVIMWGIMWRLACAETRMESSNGLMELHQGISEEALSIDVSYACVSIYIRQLSSFRGTQVMVYRSDCRYLPYSVHFSGFMPIFSRENGQNTKILEVRHSRMVQKWLPTVTRRAEH